MPAEALIREIRRLHRSGEALAAMQRASELFRIEGKERERLRRPIARLADEMGLVVPAIREWEVLLQESPDDSEALVRLAILHAAAGRAEEAASFAVRAFDSGARDEEFLREMVDTLAVADRTQLHRVLEELARERGPEDPLLALLRSLAAESAGGAERDEADLFALPENACEQAAGAPAAAPLDRPPLPADDQVVRFMHRFGGREDVYARMWADGRGGIGYSPIREPLTLQKVRMHLLGSETIGVYPVRLDGKVKFFAIDLDINKESVEEARAHPERAELVRLALRRASRSIRTKLTRLGFDPLEESSGHKGRHFWVFLEPPQDASEVHGFGRHLLAELDQGHPDLHLEFFPKQGGAGAKLGNLIKLPLGIHLKTGFWSLILDEDGAPSRNPHDLIARARAADPALLGKAAGRLRKKHPRPASAPERPPAPAAGAGAPDDEAIGPAPPPPPPAWTEEDFERDPRTSTLLESCAVLAELRRRVREHRRITADEVVVLRGVLGHFTSGVLAANYLMQQCPSLPESALLKSPLRGNPISCPRIRKRIPSIAGSVPCECVFDDHEGSYPTPLLHLRGVEAEERGAPAPSGEPITSDAARRTPEEIARVLGGLERRKALLDRQTGELRKTLLEHLAGTGKDRIELEEGAYVRLVRGGVEELVWEPAGRERQERDDGG